MDAGGLFNHVQRIRVNAYSKHWESATLLPMRIDILTIFPRLFDSFLSETIIKRAQQKKKVAIHVYDFRVATTDRHHTVDDKPYGGGPGMILKVEPIVKTLEKVLKQVKIPKRQRRVILLSPQGKTLTQAMAHKLATYKQLVFISGRYEGFDERVSEYVDEQISIGNYVLSGGEVPAMVVMDTVIRLLPGVLGNADSTKDESFSSMDVVEYPQYTRPEVWRGKKVPPILLSGDHQKISRWRQAKRRRTPKT